MELSDLRQRFAGVRGFSETLIAPLKPEDCVIQSMPDVSPTRWHLAHTTWFFETFVLKAFLPKYEPLHPAFEVLFNSYYNTVGEQFPRSRRGLLSRPTLEEVKDYRCAVDEHVVDLLAKPSINATEIARVMEIGLQHEQQHQELMLTDIKHVFSCNPLHPVYRERTCGQGSGETLPLSWLSFGEGLFQIGHDGAGFAFDNEYPRHRTFVESFQLADRLTTCGEFLDFIEDDGYARPELWLSEGWRLVGEEGWQAPLYWSNRDGQWQQFTLEGMRGIERNEPVCHVSYFEADAFARWSGARLPTEAEWEIAARSQPTEGNFVESEALHPVPCGKTVGLRQIFGDVWEWTSSQYSPYPGYFAAEGALGEYNGKFMCNQFVLRGGSCATSQSHIRPSYRNFFPPDARWQFSGIRLARGIGES